MDVRVVDASALAALVFGEPDAERVAESIDEARLVAPALLWFEMANVTTKKMKAHRRLAQEMRTTFDLSRQLAIEVLTVDHSEVIDLALTTRLTTYDASYLWLARQLDADLVTLDARLGRAAAR